VYQDMGNTNFTFLSSKAIYDKERNTAIITNALKKKFNVDAGTSHRSLYASPSNPFYIALSGRNDILVAGQKISGAAYKMSGVLTCFISTL